MLLQIVFMLPVYDRWSWEQEALEIVYVTWPSSPSGDVTPLCQFCQVVDRINLRAQNCCYLTTIFILAFPI